MRRSHWISLGVLALFICLPQATHAAVNTFFGPIVPTSGQCTCTDSAPDWGCMLQLIQNLMNFIVTLATVAITIFIALAGLTYMTSGGNPEKRSLANKRIMNAVIGLLIVLCAYLLVDSLMKVLYNSKDFGPWNSILVGNGKDYCIQPSTAPSIYQAFGTVVAPNNANGGAIPLGSGKGGTAQCSPSNPACSVSTLQSAGLSTAQAKAMSCIAVSESSGNPSVFNGASGACGTFQILSGHSTSNWNNSAYHSGSCSVNSSCNDASCNLQTAVIMFTKSSYSPWICPGCNAKAHACVANFDPGHGE